MADGDELPTTARTQEKAKAPSPAPVERCSPSGEDETRSARDDSTNTTDQGINQGQNHHDDHSDDNVSDNFTRNDGDGADDHDNDTDGARDLERLSRVSTGPPYTIFSSSMIWWIVIMNCVSAFFSPITANIYFPAVPQMSKSLGVSTGEINLTITTYMIMQGLAPTFFGDFGDAAGRRPAFLIAFSIYLAANIGLALQRSYPALLVLRMLQSGGSGGTVALCYAVVADIVPASRRGKYMGIVGAGLTVGPALGPVIGGLLSQYLGWPSIFWFLFIATVVWLIPYALSVPETGRKVVGNGSIPPQPWNMTLPDYLRFRKQSVDRDAAGLPKQKIPFPNPLNALVVILQKDMATLMFYNATLYIGIMLVTSTLSSQFKDIYHFDQLKLGLCYLPIGGATMAASLCNGFLMDWNYGRVASKLGITIDRKAGNQPPDFPIEKVRLQLAMPMIAIGFVAYVAFGWSLDFELHFAIPLVLSFFIGWFITGSFQIINATLVDLSAGSPATAMGANNLVRCSFGAIGVAVIDDMIKGMGRGWAYTFIGLLFLCLSPVLFVVMKKGPKWRQEKLEKIRLAAEKKKLEQEQQQQQQQQGQEMKYAEVINDEEPATHLTPAVKPASQGIFEESKETKVT